MKGDGGKGPKETNEKEKKTGDDLETVKNRPFGGVAELCQKEMTRGNVGLVA